MQPDPFAAAFEQMAHERSKMSWEEFIEELRAAYAEAEQGTETTPDVIVMIGGEETILTLSNGVNDQSALFLMEMVKHNMLSTGVE